MASIRLFIWGYQRHFQLSVQHAAENLFHRLDSNFEVETFLIGISRGTSENVHPICLEPEDCGFDPTDFNEIREQAIHHLALDPERNIVTTLETHQQNITRRVSSRALRNAVLGVLQGWYRRRTGTYYFNGFTPVDQHDVGVVLRLDFRGKKPPYRLPKVHAEERFGAFHSFVDAAASKFLNDCTKSLRVGEPGEVSMHIGRPSDELLREAGKALLDTPVWAGTDRLFMYGLFDACNRISEMTYEGANTVGSILVTPTGHPNIDTHLKLQTPVAMHETRRVRKLVEVSGGVGSLHCDGSNVIGLGRKVGYYDQSRSDLFEIRFIRHHYWELRHDEHSMLHVQYGLPALPQPRLDSVKLFNDIERIFPGIQQHQASRLVRLALASCNLPHGALLVVSAAAEAEAHRLQNQSTLIEPMTLTPEIVAAVAAIDGAILVDQDATCFAIGVILDGLATPYGDPARGARFNSSVRYVADKTRCLAVIVSEDGSAQWLPELRPLMERKTLEAKLGELLRLLESQQIDLDQSHKLLRWLDEHRFYLDLASCKQANALMSRHDKECRSCSRITIVYREFSPDPEMGDTYIR